VHADGAGPWSGLSQPPASFGAGEDGAPGPGSRSQCRGGAELQDGGERCCTSGWSAPGAGRASSPTRSVEQVDAALSSAGAGGSDHGVLRRERAPVWEMVEAVIRSGETYAPSFYILLAIA